MVLEAEDGPDMADASVVGDAGLEPATFSPPEADRRVSETL